MEAAKIDPILRSSLEDSRLSRAERRELKSFLEEMSLDASGVAFVQHRAFALARETADVASVDWLEGVMKTLATVTAPAASAGTGRASVFFSPGEDCLRNLLSLIQQAKKEIDVCVFTVTDDRISKAMIEAHRRGTAVRVITDNDKSLDRGSDVSKLEGAGLDLRMDRSEHHMHHKFAVFDRKVVATGSYNWTRSAARHNRENVAVTDEPKLVRPYQEAFDDLWKRLA